MYFRINLVTTLLILKVFRINSENDTVDYYVNLIQQEILKTFISQPPTDLSEFRVELKNPTEYEEYDYIIVGAGSTGTVLANRLSEVAENQVLLIEVGGTESDFSNIPAMAIYLQRSGFNWNYNTTPQSTSCLGFLNEQCAYPRGRGLGGSSIINALMYVRGNKEDYNNWYRQGNTGWSYEDVLPYFIKSENSNIDGDPDYHGIGGHLNVEHLKSNSPQLDAFFDANLELGRKVIDYNGKNQLGVSKVQFNTIKGRRDSNGKAFLKPALKRSNLHVLSHSLVVKILINPKTKAAHGVLYSNGKQLFEARTRKEVIISAGVIGSPHLLMLSGIGPRDHLQKLGIPVIQSLDVGYNFQDHSMYIGINVETNYTEPTLSLEQNVKDFLNGDGLFTRPLNVQGLGFFQTNLTKISDVPDIEMVFIPSNSSAEIFKRAFYLTDASYDTVFGKVNPSNTFLVPIAVLHPKSQGRITLNSRDPFVYPLIDSQYLSDPDDVDIETMYQGINLALEMINTNAFKKLHAKLAHTPLPQCQHYEYLSKEYWYCQIRQLTFHIFHGSGTCKMGPNPKKGAVVDSSLRVHGIKNLRVADASIIPDAISGHTSAACTMIGEKLADMIKNGN